MGEGDQTPLLVAHRPLGTNKVTKVTRFVRDRFNSCHLGCFRLVRASLK
jgi:hypothetical protein